MNSDENTSLERKDGRRAFLNLILFMLFLSGVWALFAFMARSPWEEGSPLTGPLMLFGSLAAVFGLVGTLATLLYQWHRSLWRTLTVVLTVVVVAVALAPFWIGYFGSEAAAWVSVWRPWRSNVSVEVVSAERTSRGEHVLVPPPWEDFPPVEIPTDKLSRHEHVYVLLHFDYEKELIAGPGLPRQPCCTVVRPHRLLPWIAVDNWVYWLSPLAY